MEDSPLLTQAVINHLKSGVCVIDRQGAIVAVNPVWSGLAAAHTPVPGGAYRGMNYFDVRGTVAPAEAEAFAAGVRSVCSGAALSFELEYREPGESDATERWFAAYVAALPDGGAVIEHVDVTDRKSLERELAKLAMTDSLTGLPNRRYFWEYGDREVARVGRFTVPATIIMVDLDHLKRINDTYGYAAGNQALRSVSEAFQTALRTVDLIGRIGGEEFGLLLPGTYENDAMSVAEKLRQEIAAISIKSGDDCFSVTASFGVAEVRPADRSIADALARADAALLEAKKAGANQARLFVETS